MLYPNPMMSRFHASGSPNGPARFLKQSCNLVSLLLAACVALFGLPAVAMAQPPQWAKGRILVQPQAGLPQAKFERILDHVNARATERIPHIKVHMVRVPQGAEDKVVQALDRNPHIEFAEKDRVAELQETFPDDPKYSDSWHLPTIQAPLAWDSVLGDFITAATLDTGVDALHSDLIDKLVPGWNSVDGSTDTSDVHGHGTEVAGVAAAESNNSLGVASVAWNTAIMPIRVTNSSDGWAYWSDIARGLSWAADHGADVANISYGVTNSSTVTSAADYMRDQGGVVVVAAGNSGSDPGYADNPAMISVSATTSSDTLASWSSFGDYIDVAAPGAGIWTTAKGGSYASPSGTSFASPVTAGTVALIMEANTALSPGEVETVLEEAADDLGDSGWDDHYGHGRVNAAVAAEKAAQFSSSDTEPPSVAVDSPSEGATVADLVPVEVSASDNVGVVEVELFVGSTRIGSDTSSPYEFSWDSTQVEDGEVTLIAYAHDEAGNTGESSGVTVTVDNQEENNTDTTAPTVEILNPSDGSTVDKKVTLSAQASDNVGMTSLALSVDSSVQCASNLESLSCEWNTRKEDSGEHSISAQAEDKAGNTATTSITVNVSSKKGGGKGHDKGGKNK